MKKITKLLEEQKFSQALNLFEKSNMSDIEDNKLLYNIGVAYFQLNHLEKSFKVFEYVLDNIENIPANKEIICDSTLMIVYIYREKHDWTKTYEMMTDYVKKYPDDRRTPSLYVFSGSCLEELGKWQNAIDFYFEIPDYVKKKINPVELYLHISRCYEKLEKYKSAMYYYEMLLNEYNLTDDEHAEVLFRQGFCLYLQKKHDDSIKTFQKIINAYKDTVSAEAAQKFIIQLKKEMTQTANNIKKYYPYGGN